MGGNGAFHRGVREKIPPKPPSSWSMSHFSVVSSAAKQAPTMSSEAGAAPVIDESLKDQWKELVGLKKRLIELADEDLSNPAIAASGEARRAL